MSDAPPQLRKMILGKRLRLFLFSYAFVVHLLGIRLYRFWAYDGGQDPSFVDHPLTNLVLPGLGGLFFSVILIVGAKKLRWSKGTLLLGVPAAAVVSTILALEAFYVLAAAYCTAITPTDESLNLVWNFLLWWMSIQTYGLVPVVLSIPLSAGYGIVGAMVLARLEFRARR
jgi:hypothetical protein